MADLPTTSTLTLTPPPPYTHTHTRPERVISSRRPSAGILTSSQLGSYDASKQYLKRTYPVTFPDTFKTHFVCSAIAGFVCSVTSAPGEWARMLAYRIYCFL